MMWLRCVALVFDLPSRSQAKPIREINEHELRSSDYVTGQHNYCLWFFGLKTVERGCQVSQARTRGCLRAGTVIEDGMNELAGVHHGLDAVEEPDEFLVPMDGESSANRPLNADGGAAADARSGDRIGAKRESLLDYSLGRSVAVERPTDHGRSGRHSHCEPPRFIRGRRRRG